MWVVTPLGRAVLYLGVETAMKSRDTADERFVALFCSCNSVLYVICYIDLYIYIFIRIFLR